VSVPRAQEVPWAGYDNAGNQWMGLPLQPHPAVQAFDEQAGTFADTQTGPNMADGGMQTVHAGLPTKDTATQVRTHEI